MKKLHYYIKIKSLVPRLRVLARVFLISVFFILSITQSLYSQTYYDKFFKALIYNDSIVKDFVNPVELERSERLGIKYTGVKNKFLISFDIDEQMKENIRQGAYKYELRTGDLGNNYTKVDFSVPAINYKKTFYFQHSGFIDPAIYYTRNWQVKESKYFIYRLSEPRYFNDYCMKKLDEFVDRVADTLGFTTEEKALFEKEKIYYIFCKDENEVEAITGFKARGMYVTAFDEIVTSYNTHYHELAHLLINYKLKNLSLYTLPFFLEGFAVAMGGRGGLAPRVVTDVGYYLQKTAMLSYDSILTNDKFYNEDASITYAVSGLYNTFLLNEIGGKQYLELYKKVNGDLSFVQNIKAEDIILPSKEMFDTFLINYEKKKTTYQLNVYRIPVDSTYLFDVDIKDNILPLFSLQAFSNYESKLFEEITKKKYEGQAYVLYADTISVKVYNCFNNELVASYDKNFSVIQQPVTVCTVIFDYINKHGETYEYFCFYILKTVFDMEFKK